MCVNIDAQLDLSLAISFSFLFFHCFVSGDFLFAFKRLALNAWLYLTKKKTNNDKTMINKSGTRADISLSCTFSFFDQLADKFVKQLSDRISQSLYPLLTISMLICILGLMIFQIVFKESKSIQGVALKQEFQGANA